MERPARGGAAQHLTKPPPAYEGSAVAWAQGPARLYDRLAIRVLEPFAEQLRGRTVLDAGAGTGAICRALQHLGATAVALDESADMLDQVDGAARLAVVGDLCSLPFLKASFDAAVSAFAISHIDTPARALAEMLRVVQPRGLILVAVFGTAPANTSKEVIHKVAAQHGYQPPGWYVHLKTQTEPLSNTPELLSGCAREAGLAEVVIADLVVDVGISSAEEIVASRTGMAHLAPFVSSLTEARRERFLRDAVAAVRESSEPVRPRVLILSSRVRA